MASSCGLPPKEPSRIGVNWDNGKENGNYRDYRDYIGVISGLYNTSGGC